MTSRRNILPSRNRISAPLSDTSRRPEPERVTLRVLLDAGVPDSVAAVFKKRDHLTILHREVLAEKTPDDVVATTALQNDAILVAIDPDMKSFPKRFWISHGSSRFANLNIIRICCNETQAEHRISQAMSLIEHEWSVSEEKAARRLWVEIGPRHIRTNR